MAKIRVIDLLNKIANGEEVPKKIKHWKEEYERDESGFIRYESKTERNLCLDLVQCLNDEVEIIEEQQDIDIQEIEDIDIIGVLKSVSINVSREENLKRIDRTEVDNFHKINEIIKQQNKILQAVKQLDKNIKDKE